MTSRPWLWLRRRVEGLITAPYGFAPDGTAVPSTRLGRALWTPPDKWQH